MQRCSHGVQIDMHNSQRAGASGHAHRARVHANRCLGEEGMVTVLSLARCSPATNHQMVVETKAGGSPFAASGAQSV